MAEQQPERRTFFLSIIYGLQGLMGAALAIPAALYLLVPARNRKGSGWTEVAQLNDLKPGQPEEVVYRRNRVDGWKSISEKTSTWLVRSGGNDVVAFAPQCTHLGCAYHWDQGKKNFVCPCHTSAFGLDGKVLEGPAPRPLDQLAVKVDGGKVMVGPVATGRA